MDSGHSARGSKAEPMRAASMRPTDSEFRVAEREEGGTAQGKVPHQQLSPFNAPVHVLHDPKTTLASQQAELPLKASRLNQAHPDPFNAPAHFLHAPGANKALVQVQKAKVADLKQQSTTFNHQTATPKQQLHQSQTEDIDHYAHSTSEEAMARRQHVENRRRGNSDGHHAIAVPAHRDSKIKETELIAPMDHHNHRRHQCDNDFDSDHDDSHRHLFKSEDAPVNTSHALPSLPHYAAPKAKIKQPDKQAAMAAPSKTSLPSHAHHDPFNAPARLIHAPDSSKAPAKAQKPKAAAAPKEMPAAPKQKLRQSQAVDIDSYAHLTSEEKIVHQQHAEERQRGSSDGHHAIAVPAHRDSEIKNDEPNDSTDYHNQHRHRHQCGDSNDSDHEDSHHLVKSEDATVNSSHASSSLNSQAAHKTKAKQLTKQDATPSPSYHEPFNGSAHLINVTGTIKAHAQIPKPNAAASTFKASQSSQAHHYPLNAPAHLIHAPGTAKAPAHALKPKAAAAHKQAHSAPQQDYCQAHPEDTDHCAHLASGETAHQQRIENRQRGNLHGHHAIAVPAHRDNKVKDTEENYPTDHHNHHRHQCDDDDCSDHDDSHRHLLKHESGPAPSHAAAASAQKPVQQQRVTAKQPMTFAKPTISSTMKVCPAPLQQHKHEPFNAPAHLIHIRTAVPSAAPKQVAPASQPKPFAQALVVASKADPKSAAIPNESASGTQPAVSSHPLHILHEPFNAPAHLIHAAGDAKQDAPAPKWKRTANHPAEPSEHLGRSVNHRGHQLQHDMNAVEASDYDIEDTQQHAATSQRPSQTARPASQHHFHPVDHSDANRISVDKFAHQERNKNRQRGNSHGHHAHAVPAHRGNKIPRHPENEDPMDHHDHYRHQYEGTQPQPNGGSMDLPMLTLGSSFSSANASGLADDTYSDAVTHSRHRHTHEPARASKASFKSAPKAHVVASTPEMTLGALFAENQSQSHRSKAQSSQPRGHLNRSVGHRGHHAQHDLNPVERFQYDIEGPSHQQQREEYILPISWFKEPTNASPTRHAPPTTFAEQKEDPSTHRYNENCQRGNPNAHHAHAVPAHRDHNPHHQHEYDDATHKHNHFHHQPHDEYCGEHHDGFGNLLPIAAGDSPLESMRKLFSAANSSGRGDYTYAEAVTHKRSSRSNTMSAPMKKKTARKPKRTSKPSIQQQHLDRSFGHRGHHAQKDLSPVEGPQYDIQGPSRHRQRHKRSQAPLIPLSGFDEPSSASIARHAPATPAPEDAKTARRLLENERHGNSSGYHDADDATDKHDHFRHQSHDAVRSNDYHDEPNNLHASAASDSPLWSIRKLFSAANLSTLRGYSYSEAVMHTRHHSCQESQKQNNMPPGMSLGALFAEALPVPAHPQKNDSNHPRKHLRSSVSGAPQSQQGNAVTPEMNLGSLFSDNELASDQQRSLEHLGSSYGHRSDHAQQDLNPVKGPDYDIEGSQYHDGQKRSEQKKTDGFLGYKFIPPHGIRARHSGTDLRQADPLSQYLPAGEYRGPLSQHRPTTSSMPPTSHPHSHSSASLNIHPQEIRTALANMPFLHTPEPSTPLLQDQPSKKERKQAQKEQRQAHRKLRKSLHQAPAPTLASAPYKPDGGLLEDYVFSEAVMQYSKHHAPDPDSPEARQHHAHAANHVHAYAAHVDHAAKGLKFGHTHISDYQKQLHHHDITQNQPQPQVQPQQHYVSKKPNVDEPKSYLSLSSKFFKQPLSPDYYADDADVKSAPQFPELDLFAHHQPARQSRCERAGPSQ
ncbi:hypothetical protein BG015_007333 [Linnemannia schmuckeri]|uniref:Uncharacterized protein n=1 Tax=Linnemannia schmuckeri TaxID=64567 RepID=A0A9P5S239_9FUNG|nr:hypothetical protein BG015_007333 [Linnemannia schmuckeri]